LSTKEIFNNEKIFQASFDNFSTDRPNDYEYIDFLYDRTFYGKYDSAGDVVLLRDSNLKQLPGTNETIWAANFVVDAFDEMRRYMAAAAFNGNISTRSNSLFSSVRPRRGWQSPLNLYHVHMEELYRNFLLSFTRKRKRNDKIINFTKFAEVFLEYIKQLTPMIPFTMTAFVQSRRCPPHVSGLVIDLAALDKNSKQIGGQIQRTYDDTNFKFFRNTARKFGFYVDKNAPWTLIANLKSDGKFLSQPFESQPNLPPEEERSGMKQYIDAYIEPGMDVHEQLYYKAYEGDIWDSLRGGDIYLLRFYMFQFYNSFISSTPYITEKKIMSTRLQGPINSASVAGEQTRVKKYYREQLDQLDKFGNIPQTFTDRYGAMFWTMFYLKTRMAETGVKLNYRKEYQRAVEIMRNETAVDGFAYINNLTKGHVKTKLNILGGKRWHSKMKEGKENIKKGYDFQIPKEEKILAPTTLPTLPSVAQQEQIPAAPPTYSPGGTTAGGTGGGTPGGGGGGGY